MEGKYRCMAGVTDNKQGVRFSLRTKKIDPRPPVKRILLWQMGINSSNMSLFSLIKRRKPFIYIGVLILFDIMFIIG